MDATADTAGAAGDEDCVARVPPDHDDFIAAEERGHRARFQNPALFEVGHGVQRQGTGYARHRVEVHSPDVPVSSDQLLDALGRDLGGRAERRLCGRRVWIGDSLLQVWTPLLIELDRQILEAHNVSLRGRRLLPPGRGGGPPSPVFRSRR